MNKVQLNLNEAELQIISIDEIKKGYIQFDKFAHKGLRGHAALVAGSNGMMGAAILSGTAANKSGTGKTTLFVPNEYFELIHLSIPEALVKDIGSKHIDFHQFNSIGIGPGLGTSMNSTLILQQFLTANKPLVLDADALNIIAGNNMLISQVPKGSILTPHLLELERLLGIPVHADDTISRTKDFCIKHGLFCIVKGHFSCLFTPDGELFYNGTGNAGMAKGGSGDVLTGLLTGILAQGFSMKTAAIMAMFIHGLAGDLARDELGEEAMTASDQITYFSKAFASLHLRLGI